MPSDRPPPEPPAAGSDPAGRRRTTGAVRDGTLVFALVLGAFVAYALGSPATYRATAVVAVEPLPLARPVELPKPADATERLRRGALDSGIVGSLATEERPVAPDSVEQASARVSSSLTVESKDGRRFEFSATASTPERAQRVVNELAQQAAKRAAQLLDPLPPPEADPGAKAKAELFDFLAAHPSVASEPAPAPTRSGPDPLILALRAERARIEAKLREPDKQPASENPYDETLSKHQLEDPDFLKRRMKEIEKALEARSKPAPQPADGGADATPAVRAEWQRLLRAVSETPKADTAPPPRLRVTLARAALPNLPVEPDRPKLVLIGILVSSIVGALAGFLRGTFEARAYRRYGTGTHPTVPLPQTTLRIPKNQLPKPIAPRSDPPPTPVPDAPVNPAPMTPIPAAPIVPSPITPIPPAPVAPGPIMPIAVASVGAALNTPIPPAATPAPPALSSTAPPTPVMANEPVPARDSAPPKEDAAPSPAKDASQSKRDAALVPVPPIVVAGPAPVVDGDVAPTTLPYPNPDPTPDPDGAPRTRGAARRITQIYGTPPPPTALQEDAKALRTTKSYGSPPIPIPPKGVVPFSPTPIPAEVLPPYRNSLRPSPMIPLARSSAPPAVAPSNRSGAPLAETGYSYVRTPVPEAHSIPQTPHPQKPPPDSIPQTPYPRKPSPPPRTEPYGSAPPVQAKRPSSDPAAPDPNRPKTPIPPEPELKKPAASVVRKHPVLASWRPDPKLAAGRRREVAADILTTAVNGCHIIGVTGVRGVGSDKSRAAVEIALALGEAKHPRVLLVEGDFHFPQIQNWMKLDVPLAAGFSQQLRARIQGAKEGRWHVVECTMSLHVLAEGVMRSPGLLLSNQFEQAMRELRSYYDIIILDAPLAPGEAESQALADVVDGVVVVGSEARSTEVVEVSRLFGDKKFVRALGI